MDPWTLLDIAPTADNRLIKQAYAAKLKATRPDEKPVEFAKLHTAFKQALVLAQNLKLKSDDKLADAISTASIRIEGDTSREQKNHPLENQVNTNKVVRCRPESLAWSKDNEEYRRVIERCSDTLRDINFPYEPESWAFLSKNPLLIDPNCCWSIGIDVFTAFSTYYKSNHSEGDVHWPALLYLDDIFGWRIHSEALALTVGSDACHLLLPLIELQERAAQNTGLQLLKGARVTFATHDTITPIKKWYFSGMEPRFFAFSVDLMWWLLALSLLDYLLMEHLNYRMRGVYLDHRYEIFAGLTFLIFWGFDSSSLRGSPGKLIFGLRVLDQNWRRLSYPRGLVRQIAFLPSIILWALSALAPIGADEYMLHDGLSFSGVFDYRRSKKWSDKSY